MELPATFSSSNPAISTVNSGGSVSGVSPGSTFTNTSVSYFKQKTVDGCAPARQSNSAPTNVVSVSQSPLILNMSIGDQKTISVTINPTGAHGNLAFATGLNANPNSSSQATFSVAGNSNATGTANYAISVSGTNSPSGIFSAVACASGACAPQGTTVTIPPQVLIQVLYGEAHGQAAIGDTVSQPAIGSAIKNRFGKGEFPGGTTATYQAVIVPSQFNGISTSITTGVQPELTNAVALFSGLQGDIVAGSPCFFSPSLSEWTAISNALQSATTVVPDVSTDPQCYTANRQLVYKSTIGNSASGNGAPAFIFERQKPSSDSPAVIQIN